MRTTRTAASCAPHVPLFELRAGGGGEREEVMRPFFLFYAEDNRVRSVLRSCAINCGLDEAEPWLDEAEPSRGSSGVLFPNLIA